MELFQTEENSLKSCGSASFRVKKLGTCLEMTAYFCASLFCSGMPPSLPLSKETISSVRGAGPVAEPVKLHL